MLYPVTTVVSYTTLGKRVLSRTAILKFKDKEDVVGVSIEGIIMKLYYSVIVIVYILKKKRTRFDPDLWSDYNILECIITS